MVWSLCARLSSECFFVFFFSFVWYVSFVISCFCYSDNVVFILQKSVASLSVMDVWLCRYVLLALNFYLSNASVLIARACILTSVPFFPFDYYFSLDRSFFGADLGYKARGPGVLQARPPRGMRLHWKPRHRASRELASHPYATTSPTFLVTVEI